MRKLLSICLGLSVSVMLYAQNTGIGINTPQRTLHLHTVGSTVYTGMMFTNTATGTTFEDGLHVGVQYQADAVGNRYGLFLTKEDIPIIIGTNNNYSQLRLLSNGNLGLGVTNPINKFELDGNIRMIGSGTTLKRIIFRNNANDADMGSIGHLNDEVISIANNLSGQSSKFYFNIINNRMGIGTTPAAGDGFLYINQNSATSEPHIKLRENQADDYARLEFTSALASRVWHVAGRNVAGTGETNRQNDLLNFWNSSRGDIMSLRGDGRVGILTTSHANGYALSVNGKIICEELRVQLAGSWPDYVFDNNYRLKPLEEVEQHIQQNKHLPGIPSAATIEAQGLDMGDMQRKMMEKIEELTLYIIAQKKETEALKSKIEILQNKLSQDEK